MGANESNMGYNEYFGKDFPSFAKCVTVPGTCLSALLPQRRAIEALAGDLTGDAMLFHAKPHG